MDQPTEHQIATLNKHCLGRGIEKEFSCPSCKTVQPVPQIENPTEEHTQINCKYGCGFMFLEEYNPNYNL